MSGTGTSPVSGDDNVSGAVAIGFPFTFYGNTYTSLYIGTNGFITFTNSGFSGCCSGDLIPTNTGFTPNNVIALAWEDLNAGGGQITTFSLSSPTRFVINFNAVNFYSATPGVTAQAILYADGTIEIHNTSVTAAGQSATQGIENATGTQALAVPGRNQTSWTATNDAYRFTPIVQTFSWSPATFLSSTTISNPVANAVTATTPYTVTVTGAGGCTSTGNATVTVNELPIVDAGTYGPVCGLDAADVPLVGSPAGGTFSGTGVSGVIGSQVFDPSVGTQSLLYSYTDGNSCSNTDPVVITVLTTDTDLDGIIDCADSCPTVPGQNGDVCDANPGPGFAPGVLTACVCVGTPCTENVVVDLRTDANSQQASFQIIADGSNAVVCSGGVSPAFPSGITTPIVVDCCVPAGCYRLVVSDSGGDGFVTGGYQLREQGVSGRRIIDNFSNFTAGSTSAISTAVDGGLFCLPIGDDKLIFNTCDRMDWVNYQYLVAQANTAVSAEWILNGANNVQDANSGYEFWIFDPNGTYSFRRFRSHNVSDGFAPATANRACHMKINNWINSGLTPHIPANVLMNVRVRGRVNGVNVGEFGQTCRMMIDAARAACPLVWLQDNPANTSDFSCGVTRNFGGTNSPANKIVAKPPQFYPAAPAGALRYQFRFRIPGEGVCILRPAQTSALLYLNWNTGTPLDCGKTYEVDVRVSKDGGATWCVDSSNPACYPNPITAWGRMCTVTINPCALVGEGGNQNLALNNGGLTMYPNPNRGDQVFITLSEIAADVQTVTVDIFDLSGKRVTARTIAVQDGFLNTALDLNGDLAGGMYLVNITAGDKTYTERLVIQP